MLKLSPGVKPTRLLTHPLMNTASSSGVSNTWPPGKSFCWSVWGRKGTTRVTLREISWDRYAARSRGFTDVPVIHGREAVVTMAKLRPSSRMLWGSTSLPDAAPRRACICSLHGLGPLPRPARFPDSSATSPASSVSSSAISAAVIFLCMSLRMVCTSAWATSPFCFMVFWKSRQKSASLFSAINFLSVLERESEQEECVASASESMFLSRDADAKKPVSLFPLIVFEL
mmetsp:Transcript_39029/g.74774  ORF Transcript_39029/g.74774 Transcript_39029/m.74774 type:complete len:229 (-) Transcript_39029:879-1565(-)